MTLTSVSLLAPATTEDLHEAKAVFLNKSKAPLYEFSDIRGNKHKKRLTHNGRTPDAEFSQKNRGVEAVLVHMMFVNNKDVTKFTVLPVEADWDKHVTIAQAKYDSYAPRQQAIMTARLLSCAMILPEQKKHVMPLAANLRKLGKQYAEVEEMRFDRVYPEIGMFMKQNGDQIAHIQDGPKSISRLATGYKNFDADPVDFCVRDEFWESKRLTIEAEAVVLGQMRQHCQAIERSSVGRTYS